MLFHKAPKGGFLCSRGTCTLNEESDNLVRDDFAEVIYHQFAPRSESDFGFVAVTSANQSRSSALLHAIASSAIPAAFTVEEFWG